MSDPVKDYPPYLDYPKPRKKQTNADRIRAMTDEDLARILMTTLACKVNPKPKTCDSCYKCTLNWLKQDVSDNG